MNLTFPVIVIQTLGGIVFALSGFVIFKHVRRWKNQERGLLPLHVWVISISYNLLVLSLMWRGPENDWAFVFASVGLCLGIYSLWILSRFQLNRRHRS